MPESADRRSSPQPTLLLAVLFGLFILFSIVVAQVAYRTSAQHLRSYVVLGCLISLWLFPWGLLMLTPRGIPWRRALALRTLGCHFVSWLASGFVLFAGSKIMGTTAFVKDSTLGSLLILGLGFSLGAAFGSIQCLGWWPALQSGSYRVAMYSSSVVVGILPCSSSTSAP